MRKNQICIVPGCGSIESTNTPDIKFYPFPKEESSKKKWLKAINRQDEEITKRSKVCSKHFKSTDYSITRFNYTVGGKSNSNTNKNTCEWKVLKADIVPSLNLPEKSTFKIKISKKDNNKEVKVEEVRVKQEKAEKVRMPKKHVVPMEPPPTVGRSRRQASKEALKQMQILLEDEEDAVEVPSDEDYSYLDIIPVEPSPPPPPKKKYKLSHRKSSDGNDRDVLVLKSITNRNAENTLELDCWVEELEEAQQNRIKKIKDEESELQAKLDSLISQANAKVIHKGDLNSIIEVTEHVQSAIQGAQNPPPNIILNNAIASNSSYQLVMDPRLGLIVGAVSSAGPTPTSTPQKVYQGKVTVAQNLQKTSTVNSQSPVGSRTMRTRRSGNPSPVIASTAPTAPQTRSVLQTKATPAKVTQPVRTTPSPARSPMATRNASPMATRNAPPTRNTTQQATRAASQPVTRGTTQPVTRATTQPVAKATSQPVTKSTSQPVTKSTSQPVTKSTSQPVTKATAQPVIKGASQQVTKGTSQLATKGTSQPVTRGASQAVTRSTPQPPAKKIVTPPVTPPITRGRQQPQAASFARPSENNVEGGLAAGGSGPASKKTGTQVVDLTNEEGRSLPDSREISFNKLQGKTYPSLVVVARPHLRVQDLMVDRPKLDAKVKSVLMHAPTKFTEWLIQQGLVRSEQKCSVHTQTALKLGMYSDVSKFPYSGGYVWISECCPQRFVSVFSGSLFEGSPHPPMVILKLLYHWSCQTNIQNVTQWVKVDNLYVKGMFTWLRSICTVALHSHLRQLGGPGVKVEVGVISLGTTSQDGHQRQVKVEVLGVLETPSKLIRLRAVEPQADGDKNYKKRFSKILEPIHQWVHPQSTLVADLTVDKQTLHNMGFNNVIQSSSNDYGNNNRQIMEYLRRIVPRMFQNTLSLLSRQIIQQFLDELVWREWFGTSALQAFDNVVLHLSEQTRYDSGQSLIVRLNKVAQNPFKSWEITLSNATNKTTENSQSQQQQQKKPRNRNKTENAKAAPQVAVDINRPPKSTSPDVPEQMVPLENYYYGTIDTYSKTPSIILNMKCPFCKSVFDNNILLMSHLFMHAHNVSEDAQLCRYCLTSVPTASDLLKHISSSHPAETKFDNGFVCLICETQYMNPFVLGKHMSKEHCPSELPYQCGTCAYRCSNHKQAIDHFYKTHDNGPTIQCPFCLKSTTVFSSSRNIVQNMNYFIQHLQKHQRKQFARRCGKCNLWFVQKDVLKDHQLRMHVSQRGKTGLIPWVAPRTGVMVPKSKMDKYPGDADVINFTTLFFNIPKNLICKECNSPMDTPKHFPSFESCQNPNCQYSTCCTNAMMEHNAKCCKSQNPIADEKLSFEMFCICGFSHTDGNQMARHLAICERKSAYPSRNDSKAAIVTHSMLDVLGLVRKPEELRKDNEESVHVQDKMETEEIKKGVKRKIEAEDKASDVEQLKAEIPVKKQKGREIRQNHDTNEGVYPEIPEDQITGPDKNEIKENGEESDMERDHYQTNKDKEEDESKQEVPSKTAADSQNEYPIIETNEKSSDVIQEVDAVHKDECEQVDEKNHSGDDAFSKIQNETEAEEESNSEDTTETRMVLNEPEIVDQPKPVEDELQSVEDIEESHYKEIVQEFQSDETCAEIPLTDGKTVTHKAEPIIEEKQPIEEVQPVDKMQSAEGEEQHMEEVQPVEAELRTVTEEVAHVEDEEEEDELQFTDNKTKSDKKEVEFSEEVEDQEPLESETTRESAELSEIVEDDSGVIEKESPKLINQTVEDEFKALEDKAIEEEFEALEEQKIESELENEAAIAEVSTQPSFDEPLPEIPNHVHREPMETSEIPLRDKSPEITSDDIQNLISDVVGQELEEPSIVDNQSEVLGYHNCQLDEKMDNVSMISSGESMEEPELTKGGNNVMISSGESMELPELTKEILESEETTPMETD